MSTLGALAVFSGLSLNLILQFGLGINAVTGEGAAEGKGDGDFSLPKWGMLFLSTLILWFVFSYIFISPAFGFLESFLLFPASVAVTLSLGSFLPYVFRSGRLFKFFPPDFRKLFLELKNFNLAKAGHEKFLSLYNGLVLAALFLTLRLALSFLEALVLILGFFLGCIAAALILREIRKRSSLEAVPRILRGSPLTLISMGLLSLIFSSVSAILLRVLGVF
jgi:electron transport complex protein RnfA